MAGSDPISDRQLDYIRSLAEAAVVDFVDLTDLDVLVRPVYRCDVAQMNRAQASMLIDDLLVELGEKEEQLDYASVFGDRVFVPVE